MKIISKLAALGVLLFALFPAVAAGAVDCASDPYCNPDTPAVDSGGSDTDVLPAEAEAEDEGTGAETTGGPAAAETAPSGSLPFTGTDVAGIAVLGAVAVGVGVVMVRRSKSMKAEA